MYQGKRRSLSEFSPIEAGTGEPPPEVLLSFLMVKKGIPFVPREFTEINACPVCLWPAPHSGVWERGGFQFAWCAACTALFMNPAPTEAELLRYYGGHYWESTNSDRAKVYRFEKQFRRAVLFAAELEKAGVAKGGRVLEIGSGYGGVVWALGQLLEMKPYAVELDPGAREFQKLLGVTIFNSETVMRKPETDGFDVVVLSHVLEHQLKPRELVEQAFSLLSSSGIVLIEVPHGHFVVDGGIDHPIVFSRFALDRLVRDFAPEVRYRVHNGSENVVLPPKYLLGVARSASERKSSPVRYRVPRSLSFFSQSLATKLRNFGPLRGLNYRLSRMLRRKHSLKVRRLFQSLPPGVLDWLGR